MDDTDLDVLDRSTLRVWRSANVLLWPALALACAVGLTGLVDAVVRTRLFWRLGFHSIVTGLEPLTSGPGLLQAAMAAGTAMTAGLAMGDLIRQVWWRPRIVALAVAGTYAVGLTVLADGDNSIARTVLQALLLVGAAAGGALLACRDLRRAGT